MSKVTGIIERFIPDAQAALRRFPLAILMAAALTVIIIIKANDYHALSDEMMLRLVGGTILAGYLSIILTLFGEGRGRPVPILAKSAVVIAALVSAYFFRQLSFVTWMAILAAILFLGSAPFWKKQRDDIAVWDFTHKLWTAVVFTVAGAIIYLIGMYSIAKALDSLFGLNINNFIEEWLLPIGFAFLAPIAWMSMLPRHDDDGDDGLRNPGFISKAVGFLGTWILAPLTLVYALILLAYGFKILLSGALPNGEIAELVTPFLIIGTLTWLILDPPFIQEKRLARWYHKTWFWLMVPAALLLLVAVYIRISAYGLTLQRYLLVLASVWALGISLWFIIKGEKGRDIRIIPGFAALLLAVGSFGPWGADGLSALSQNARLAQALTANNMLANGKLHPESNLNIKDTEAAMRAKGALEYLIDYRKTGKLEKFLGEEEAAILLKLSSKDEYVNESAIIKRFGLLSVHSEALMGAEDIAFVSNSYAQNEVPISIHGFANMMYGQQYWYFRNDDLRPFQAQNFGDFELLADEQYIVVKRQGKTIARKDMFSWLLEQPVIAGHGIDLSPRLVLFEEGGTKIAIHIMLASYKKRKTGVWQMRLKFIILWKDSELSD